MTASEQIRERLKIHRERCEICLETERTNCAVAAGLAHDLRRAITEEERQLTLALPSAAYERLRRNRVRCYHDRRRRKAKGAP